MKISENIEKITNPGFKNVFRLYDNETGKALADVITLREEGPLTYNESYEIFDEHAVWKRKDLKNFTARELLVKIFDKGRCVYDSPSLDEIKDYCREQIDTLWGETLRFENPQTYYVDLSKPLWSLKHELLNQHHARD